MTSEQRTLLEKLISEQPELTDSQIAEQVSVSRACVWKARKTRPLAAPAEDSDPESALLQIERLIQANLPPERLVRGLGELIMDPKTPKSVKLMAIRTAAEYGGVVTRKEKRESEAIKTPGPIIQINLAPGAAAVMAAPVKPQAVVVEAERNVLPESVRPVSE